MKGKVKGKKRSWSLHRLLIVISVVLIIIWGILFLVSSINIATTRKYNSKVFEEVLDIEVYRLENRLRQVEEFLAVALITDKEFTTLRNQNLSHAQNLRQVSERIDSYSRYFSDFSGMFFYEKDSETLLMKQWNDQDYYSMSAPVRRQNLISDIKNLCAENSESKTTNMWLILDMDGISTAIYIYPYYEQYLGIYISVNGILNRLMDLEKIADAGKLDLIDSSGDSLSDTIEHTEKSYYSKLSGSINGFPAFMEISIPQNKFLRNWYQSAILFGVLIILSGTLLVFLVITMRKVLFYPLAKMNEDILEISKGNLEHSMELRTECEELEKLSESFRNLMLEIRNMKIENYEEQLKRQDVLLKYLHIQKNPHFFLNMLNVIYALSMSGQVTQIKTITMMLIRHIRYVLMEDKVLVRLEDELEFTNNYLEIQKIRFPNEIFYEESRLTDEMKEIRIPPLLIQTFVENSTKYAYRRGNKLSIEIRVSKSEEEISIRIFDNGPGYPEEMIKTLNESGTVLSDTRGEHIGIYNVLSRMELLYGDQYSYHFENESGQGAGVEFKISKSATEQIRKSTIMSDQKV